MGVYEWYPGHMTKAIRMMRENLSLIDLVIEVADARIPAASRNPDINELCNGKARLLVLTKPDLSDARFVKEWLTFYKAQGLCAVSVNAKNPGDRKALLAAADAAAKEKKERNRRRGLVNQPIRALVAGIPNVGKSTLINLLAGKSVAKTGNKPGVTRGKQWIQTGGGLLLLDSPGILWPKIGDKDTGELLALIGSMNDDKLDETALAVSLIGRLTADYPDAIADRYGVAGSDREEDPQTWSIRLLQVIARVRGLLGEGGVPLTERAASLLLNDYRNGRLGGMIMERPNKT